MATQALIRHRIGIGFRYLLLITLTLVIILPFVLGLWTSFLPTTTIANRITERNPFLAELSGCVYQNTHSSLLI